MEDVEIMKKSEEPFMNFPSGSPSFFGGCKPPLLARKAFFVSRTFPNRI